MIYTFKIKKAIAFAVQVHEIDSKQKRKGKDIPYVTHPLGVGIILARAGADEDVIVAGILHDTIEDSIPEKKVSRDVLVREFGENVASLVMSVSEASKELSWEERKKEALAHIKTFSHDSLLVKSADILSNVTELVDDYEKDGEKVFDRFNAAKMDILQNYLRVIAAIIAVWDKNPMASDLCFIAGSLELMGEPAFMAENPAMIIEYGEYDENAMLDCHVCGWSGTPKGSGTKEYSSDLFSISCSICGDMLLIVNYPLVSFKE